MFNPLNEDLMFQEMHERTDAMRRARTAGTTPARRWWKSQLGRGTTRRAR